MAQRSNAHVLGATLVGGALGAGLMILFAPRSGKETRHMIHENFDNAKQGAEDRLAKLSKAIRHTGKKAKASMEEMRDSSHRKTKRQSPVLSAWEEEV